MALTFIASASGTSNSAGTTLDCSTTLNVAAGDLLVVTTCWEDAASTTTVAESAGGNSFTMNTAGNDASNYIRSGYVLSAAANSTSTFRMTSDSVAFRRIIVMQFRPDASETVSLDAGPNAANVTTGSTQTTATITTTGTDEVVIANLKTYDPTSGYTSATIGGAAVDGSATVGGSNDPAFMIYKLFTSTQSGITGVFTDTISDTEKSRMEILAFKSVAGGTVTVDMWHPVANLPKNTWALIGYQ